jgi:hypothetical protein
MHSPGLYDGSGLLPREYGLSVYDIGGQYERLKRRVEVAERAAAALDFSDTPMSRGRRADPSRLAAAVPDAAQPVAVEETATATSPLVYVAAASVAAVALFILVKK